VRERTGMLRYTYISNIVVLFNHITRVYTNLCSGTLE